MNTLLILQGIPASGKSTYAKQWMKEDPESRVIVNRDSIRRMLGTYWIPSREELVTEIENFIVSEALNQGYDVCIDATNLNKESIKRWMSVDYNVMISFKKFNISLEEALERDKNREFPVGEQVIINFYNKYCNEIK